jgi:CBS-domain-containing membrane protein
MSPRAACRLESLGFIHVHDYAAGKTDWAGSGLPKERAFAGISRPRKLAKQVPTCRLDERVAVIRERVSTADLCIVTTEGRIVLGRLREKDREQDGEVSAEAVMQPGPTTVRVDEFLPDLVERMRKANVESILATKPSGELVGVLHRADGEAVLAQAHDHHHHEHQ